MADIYVAVEARAFAMSFGLPGGDLLMLLDVPDECPKYKLGYEPYRPLPAPDTDTKSAAPFRFLDLPAELRLRIYEYALTAPDNAIRVYSPHHKERIASNLALGLLRTCRQIYSEARDVLYQENTVFVHANCSVTNSPVIGSSQLPPYALKNLRDVYLVMEEADDFSGRDFGAIDFRPFQAMTQLRKLRIAIMVSPYRVENGTNWTNLLSYLVERIPGNCKLEYGSSTGAQKRFASRFISWYKLTKLSEELSRDTLMRAVGYSQSEQGCKSGSTVDWRNQE